MPDIVTFALIRALPRPAMLTEIGWELVSRPESEQVRTVALWKTTVQVWLPTRIVARLVSLPGNTKIFFKEIFFQ